MYPSPNFKINACMKTLFKNVVMSSVMILLLCSFNPIATKYTVYIFFSPDCPMCIKYVYTLNQLNKDYKKYGVNMIAACSNYFTPTSAIAQFKLKHNPNFTLLHDKGAVLAQKFKATITPEVVVVDKKEQVLYRGLVDNWFYSPGKYRQVTTEFYLKDALDSLIANKEVRIKTTNAIGCYLLPDENYKPEKFRK